MSLTNDTVALSHGTMDLMAGGEGPTLLLLHRDIGRPGWGSLQQRLAGSYRVLMPSLPGFDRSDRPEWLRNVPDMAAIFGQFLDQLGDERVGLAGLGFGGWVAAELAARSPARVARLFLHAPLGIKPPEGEIVDFVLWDTLQYIRLGFESESVGKRVLAEASDDQRAYWENNREMVARIAWKPYMHNPSLPHLLRASTIPTLSSWSRGDRIVPRSAALAYGQVMPKGRFIQFEEGGHHADIETPDLLAKAIEDHFGALRF
jgi:pimeloyl-ACP methyl ester carboxylesterase